MLWISWTRSDRWRRLLQMVPWHQCVWKKKEKPKNHIITVVFRMGCINRPLFDSRLLIFWTWFIFSSVPRSVSSFKSRTIDKKTASWNCLARRQYSLYETSTNSCFSILWGHRVRDLLRDLRYLTYEEKTNLSGFPIPCQHAVEDELQDTRDSEKQGWSFPLIGTRTQSASRKRRRQRFFCKILSLKSLL